MSALRSLGFAATPRRPDIHVLELNIRAHPGAHGRAFWGSGRRSRPRWQRLLTGRRAWARTPPRPRARSQPPARCGAGRGRGQAAGSPARDGAVRANILG